MKFLTFFAGISIFIILINLSGVSNNTISNNNNNSNKNKKWVPSFIKKAVDFTKNTYNKLTGRKKSSSKKTVKTSRKSYSHSASFSYRTSHRSSSSSQSHKSHNFNINIQRNSNNNNNRGSTKIAENKKNKKSGGNIFSRAYNFGKRSFNKLLGRSSNNNGNNNNNKNQGKGRGKTVIVKKKKTSIIGKAVNFGKNIFNYAKGKYNSLVKLVTKDKKEKKKKKQIVPKYTDNMIQTIGLKFCMEKCKVLEGKMTKKCVEGETEACNYCVLKKNPKTKDLLDENKMCMDLCNQTPKQYTCKFYPLQITVSRKAFDEKLLKDTVSKGKKY